MVRRLLIPIGLAALMLLVPSAVSAQQDSLALSCFSSWSVSTFRDTETIRVSASRWILRWRRVTPRHTEHDGLFVEVYRAVDDSTPKEDQVAAINTDHDGQKGTKLVDESGTFWLHGESWAEETECRVEACTPSHTAGGRGRVPFPARPEPEGRAPPLPERHRASGLGSGR